ncbi:MAG TPA: sodium ion-translocating decarboxylase subunit beta [Symbiobacteriaceae bacterium]|jgi:oxaloacetate decarboxylase beta subunit|nr:sodium ion-translocating decarboxylase subunit beta [Symbiobacteriaceae bacterium]
MAWQSIWSQMNLSELVSGVTGFTWQQAVMLLVGGVLIYLAIVKEYEPLLLAPVGFGCLLANIPLSSAIGGEGWLTLLYNAGIKTELFPVLIFIAVGAMCDFTPLLSMPFMMLFGAAAQFGIFMTMLIAALLGFDIKEAASIGIIGAADGPTTIVVASQLAPRLLGPLTVCAYTYMSLVPIIQPPVIRALTTRNERRIKMVYDGGRPVSRTTKILFPILVTIVAGLLVPSSVALIGALMFGNLLRECTGLEKLSKAAQAELANIVTLLLGITIGSTMEASAFLNWGTLGILGLGVVAFAFDTAGGVLFAKFLNLFLKRKVNPMLGAAGISAFPMSARVIAKMAQKEDPGNYLIMHAVGANVAGQIASIMAGGLILALVR